MDRYPDLDATVQINPEEAGLFDLLVECVRISPDDAREYSHFMCEVDLFIQTGVSADCEVYEIDYLVEDRVRKGMITGSPKPDMDPGTWFITLEVKQ